MLVARSTVSRTLRKNRLSSSPGIWKCASKAAANGLCSAPSSAIWSAFAAMTTMVLRGTLSTRARPGVVATARPGDRQRPRDAFDKRVVAAAIQQDDADLARLRNLAQQPVQRHCLVQQVALALELCVGRNQIVFPIHLDAVAGIVDHRHVRARGSDAKFANAAVQRPEIRIVQFGDVELQPAQAVADRACIVYRSWPDAVRSDRR